MRTFFDSLRQSHTRSRGFSLPEVIVVVAILGILASIAIPAALSQKRKGIEASMTSDTLSVVSNLEELNSGWRNQPPKQVDVTTATQQGSWEAATASPATTVASGALSGGNVATGTMWTNGSFCVRVTNQSVSNSVALYKSSNDTVETGTSSLVCPTTALPGAGTVPTGTSASGTPAAVGLANPTTSTPNQITVSWTAPSSPVATGYIVTVPASSQATPVGQAATAAGASTSNQPSWETSSGSTISVTFVNMTAGPTEVTVRAKNANGTGPATTKTAVVTGTDLAPNGLTVTGNSTVSGNIDVDGTITKTGEGWNTVATFTNGWTNFNTGFPVAAYKKGPDGTVEIRGLIKSGTNATTAFTLPVGYRPSSRSEFITSCAGGGCALVINVAGNVIPNSLSGTNSSGYTHLFVRFYSS